MVTRSLPYNLSTETNTMTQPQHVTLCSTHSRRNTFFTILKWKYCYWVCYRKKKNRLSSSSRLEKMRNPFLFGFQITAKLLPVPIVHVSHEFNGNVTQDDHDHRAFYPQTRFCHPFFFDFRRKIPCNLK